MDDKQMEQSILQITKTLEMTNGDIKAIVTEMKAVWRRLDDQKTLTETVHELALAVRDLVNAQKNTADAVLALRKDMEEKNAELMKDVEDIKSKPGKRWEALIGLGIAGVVGAFIQWILSQTGLKS